MATATKNTPAATPVSGKVRTVRFARKVGGAAGMTLNTGVLSAKAAGSEFWHELLKPLSAEELAQL